MLPTELAVTNHPEIGTGELQLVKIKEQNGTSTYKTVFPSGNELQLDVRHSDEKKVGSAQYERHNFDVKYTIFNEDQVRGNDVYQFYCVVRRRKGTNPLTLEEHTTSTNAVFNWLLPRIISGES